MKNEVVNRKFITKSDIIIILIIVAIGFGIFLFNMNKNKEGDLIAVVTYEGEELYNIELDKVSEPYNIVINQEQNLVLAVDKGRIRYLSSNCYDQICVNSGWLDYYGDFAACAPFRSTISVEASGEGDGPDVMLN